MRPLGVILLLVVLLLTGCGEDEETSAPRAAEGSPAMEATRAPADADPTEAPKQRGTEIVLGDSEFGDMLFDSRDQAIYVFENDDRDETNCYGECAEAWPPVYTEGDPAAGDGVDAAKLGTIERRDGRLQITYAGRPLYYYAHEAPGEVKCHNVDLNGGLWWVVGADGEPLQ